MSVKQRVFLKRRKYNQWVANETLEDFALRYTAKRARKWSSIRIANTALGIVSFLALEAIGGAITLQYGFTNSMWAIIVVCSLIFLTGLPICYYAARYGLDIDLLTRGAGFGYIGSTISSLVYASFTFIFFALEAAIMSMALKILLGIPISLAYVISAIAVIPLVTHGITRISRFQLWTQPIWIILQILPLLVIFIHHSELYSNWVSFPGLNTENNDINTNEFNLIMFGAAAAVIFPLIAQNGEQVDFLRFLPNEEKPSKRWWLSLIIAGPGWSIFGLLKLFAGSFLAVLALQSGIDIALADDPAHMYLIAFNYVTHNPDLALALAATFVIISQLKINVTNAYAGSIAWSNFFSRLTHDHPGRIVWLFFNVAIALLLMELGLYQAFESILVTYSALVLAWVGSIVADLIINKPLGLRPAKLEFKRGHLYDINPVGVFSMIIASTLGIIGQLGVFGETFKALSPFIALFTPFITAPFIAWWTKGKYYQARENTIIIHKDIDTTSGHHEIRCMVCENKFDPEDISTCPAYAGEICSLCCSLDASCHDQCRPKANLKYQVLHALRALFPKRFVTELYSVKGHFLVILTFTSLLMAALLALVYFPVEFSSGNTQDIVENLLTQTFFLLLIVTGVLVWLYVLAESSKRKAFEELQKQNERLVDEVSAHEQTALLLQDAKEAAVSANHAKSIYLSGVSHELRTPLNTIFGYSQLLENDQKLSIENRQAASSILRNSEHLADVIEGLLEISKIEARRLDINRDEVNLTVLLDQIVDIFKSQAQAKRIEFDYQHLSNIPGYVTVDKKRLRQILTNLLSNAIKFTDEGKVSFYISYRNSVAKFFISDTGIGIKQQDQEKIFEPFERLQYSDTMYSSGTGLGLSISRLLSNLIGGDISLKSEYGKGTQFTFSLMLPAVYEPKIKSDDENKICGYLGKQKTILIVDDEVSHRKLNNDYLTPLGFNIIEAHTAKKSIAITNVIHIDLYILDISLPDENGLALCNQLREMQIKAPIIMLSANAVDDINNIKFTHSFNGHFLKPVRLETLLAKIGLLLRLKWRYNENTINQKQQNLNTTSELLPLQSDLDDLMSMAQIGYLNGVMTKLEKMQNNNNSKFIQQLKSKAAVCDFEGLIQAIKGMGKL